MKIKYLYKKQIALTVNQEEFLTTCQNYTSYINDTPKTNEYEIDDTLEAITQFISHNLDHILRAYLEQNEVILVLLKIISKEIKKDSSPLALEEYLLNAILNNHGTFSDNRFIEAILDLTNNYFETTDFSTISLEDRLAKQDPILKVIENKIKAKASEDGFQEWFLNVYKKNSALLSTSEYLSTLATDFLSAKSLEGLPATHITEEVDLSRERSTIATIFSELETILLEKHKPCSDHFFNNVCVANYGLSFSDLTQKDLIDLEKRLTILKEKLEREGTTTAAITRGSKTPHAVIKGGINEHRGLLFADVCIYRVDVEGDEHDHQNKPLRSYNATMYNTYLRYRKNDKKDSVHNSNITSLIIHKPKVSVVTSTPNIAITIAPTQTPTQAIIPMFAAGAAKVVVAGGGAPETEGATASIPESIQVLITSIRSYKNDKKSATVYIDFLQNCQTKLSQITDKDLSEYAAGKERCPELPKLTSERKWEKEKKGEISTAKEIKHTIVKHYNKQNDSLTTIWKLQAEKLESFTKETLEEEVDKYADVLTKEQETIIRAKIKELKVKAEAAAKKTAEAAAKKTAEAAAKKTAEAAAKKTAEAAAKKAKKATKAAANKATEATKAAANKATEATKAAANKATAFKVAGVAVFLGALASMFQEDEDGQVGALTLGFSQLFSTLGLASWLSGSDYLRNRENYKTDITDQNANTMLRYAALNGDERTINLLLEQGINIDDINLLGQTALFSAIEGGNINSLNALLNAGADANKADKYGVTTLFQAAQKGCLDCIIALLNAGARVDKASINGVSPLHIASQNGHKYVVNRLLQAGAEVDKTEEKEISPLYIAAEYGHLDCVNALLKAGADSNKPNINKLTPLAKASQNGHKDVVNRLLNAGADVDKADKDGNTPLRLASQNGHRDCVNALLKAGAEVDKADKGGITPLHFAAFGGYTNCVKALLNAGADINAVTDNGFTPTVLAQQEGHVNSVIALKKAIKKQQSDKIP